MGAPKQKWTTEEEAALKAGVLKHGAGKWRTILKDPQFSGVLYQRSNVDLKDKWRNMSVMANGWGSREKARLALKRMVPAPKENDNAMSVTPVIRSGEKIINDKPSAASRDSSQTGSSKRSMRLDNLIMEAIYNLKEPGGSNKTTIGTYIEEQYWAPPNFTRLLTAKLRFLAASGKLIKTKRKYRIAPTTSFSTKRKKSSMSLLEGSQKQKDSRKDDSDESGVVVQSHSAADLDKMGVMTIEEAAAAAAKAVAEAEVAIAEAEEAARHAEAAEAEAEAAKAFAEAAMEALKGKNYQRMMIRA